MTVFWTFAAAAAYFLPAITGACRRVTNEGSVFAVNLFLGWTLIGWVVALAMALRTSTEPRPARMPPGSYSWRNIGRSTPRG